MRTRRNGPPRIRLVSDGATGKDAHVYYADGDDDWFETELSRCVQRVTIAVDCADLTRATLEVVMVHTDLTAQLDAVIVNHVWLPRLWRLRKLWWRVRRPKRSRVKLRDVTTLGEKWRRWHSP